VTIAGWKVGFLGSAETVSAVAEVLSDYPDVPLVSYLPQAVVAGRRPVAALSGGLSRADPAATEVLVGNHKTLTDFLLPDWDSERPPRRASWRWPPASTARASCSSPASCCRPRGRAVHRQRARLAAGCHDGREVRALRHRLRRRRRHAGGSAGCAAGAGSELQAAVGEALSFLDQSLDAGFRPGMGNVVPDRFFWALPPDEEGEGEPCLPTKSDQRRRPTRAREARAVSTESKTTNAGLPSSAPSASSPAA
jgi:hydroxymethylpyrimidine/phosphomethylpyrimidine kinase